MDKPKVCLSHLIGFTVRDSCIRLVTPPTERYALNKTKAPTQVCLRISCQRRWEKWAEDLLIQEIP